MRAERLAGSVPASSTFPDIAQAAGDDPVTNLCLAVDAEFVDQ